MAVYGGGMRLLRSGIERLLMPVSKRSVHCSCPRKDFRPIFTGQFKVREICKAFELFVNARSAPLFLTQYTRFYATKTAKSEKKKGTNDKLDVRQGATIPYHELPIICIKSTYNNTMFTISDHKGHVAASTSAGIEGFKGAKRGTNYAGQMAATSAAKKARSLGIQTVRVKIKGMGPGRNSSIKGLMAGGLDIISITDVTPVPHNGCKPPKQRRI